MKKGMPAAAKASVKPVKMTGKASAKAMPKEQAVGLKPSKMPSKAKAEGAMPKKDGANCYGKRGK